MTTSSRCTYISQASAHIHVSTYVNTLRQFPYADSAKAKYSNFEKAYSHDKKSKYRVIHFLVSKVHGHILTTVTLNSQAKHVSFQFCVLKGDYGALNRPTTSVIGKI